MEPLLEYIEQVQARGPGGYVTVILPEFVPRRLWQHLLHNQHALLIKGALLFKPNVVVTSVPFHLGRGEAGEEDGLAWGRSGQISTRNLIRARSESGTAGSGFCRRPPNRSSRSRSP